MTRYLTLFSAVVILLTGHGLQLTLLPLRAAALGWDAGSIGLTASFYFAGFLAGCVLIPRFIVQVGHIRVFSATTTLCGVSLMAIILSDHVAAWCGLRFLTGVGISGSYIIIESWLNAQTTNERRGTVLAIYSLIVLVGMTLGQSVVAAGEPLSVSLLVIGAILLSLALMPLTLLRVEQPVPPLKPEFPLREVISAAPAGVGAAFILGAVTGALFTVTPVATTAIGWDASASAQAMMALVLGGAALQLPAGRLSDAIDRRYVMVGLVVLAGLAATGGYLAGGIFWPTLAALFVFGGAAIAVYPIALSHANDRMPGAFLQVGSVILLVNSLGAVVGPTGGAYMIELVPGAGYFYFMLMMLVLALIWLIVCLLRRTDRAPVDAPAVPLPRSSPAALELDPRADSDPVA